MSGSEIIREHLLSMGDKKYSEFSARLTPSVDKELFIGIKIPQLRKYAAELFGTAQAEEFIAHLPHKYYDENNLHGYIIERIKDYDRLIEALNDFLPYIDNWATCDTLSPKIFKKHPAGLYEQCLKWIRSEHVYTVRFGIGRLMAHFLDEKFSPEVLRAVEAVKSDEYYIVMMQAWFFATALAKQKEATLPIIESRRLPADLQKKTIQKSVESNRISPETKAYLRTLKIR